jgi:hypothetical protein
MKKRQQTLEQMMRKLARGAVLLDKSKDAAEVGGILVGPTSKRLRAEYGDMRTAATSG